MMIYTPRLRLRRWQESDKAPFRAINVDPRTTEFYPAPCTAEESDQILERAERHFEKNGFGLFAAEEKETGALLGFVGLQWVPFEAPFTPAVEIGWRIAPSHWNRGFATEAALAVLDFGFAKMAMREIIALTAVPNARSRRVMEKLGMQYDPTANFEHPRIAEGHPLRSHVLYRATNPQAS